MNFHVKIRLNRLSDFCYITLPGPHRLACTPLGLGLWKYHIWVISVSNFKLQIAFLLSILINFPVRLIMSGVLFLIDVQWRQGWSLAVSKARNHHHISNPIISFLSLFPTSHSPAVLRMILCLSPSSHSALMYCGVKDDHSAILKHGFLIISKTLLFYFSPFPLPIIPHHCKAAFRMITCRF